LLTLRFSAQDLARTRFAYSPLGEAVHSLRALKDPGGHAVHLPWARRTRALLTERQVRFELLSALVRVPASYIPDFLTPVPETGRPSLEDQLTTLVATPPDAVRADLDRVAGPLPLPVEALRRDPVAGLSRLTDEVRAYWELAVAPHWTRVRRLLEGEILQRARLMADGGAAALFADVHPMVSWKDGVLRVDHRSYHHDCTLEAGKGLVLIPSVFVWPECFSQTNPPRQPGLIHPARGVACLWESGSPAAPDGLVRVFGRSRAVLLAVLDAPHSTTELAAHTGMPAPTVSHHLKALHAAGLATAQRVGRSVLYLRTPAADLLFDDAESSFWR
jgi:DNA-binding transcriptional ArsR family regulator